MRVIGGKAFYPSPGTLATGVRPAECDQRTRYHSANTATLQMARQQHGSPTRPAHTHTAQSQIYPASSTMPHNCTAPRTPCVSMRTGTSRSRRCHVFARKVSYKGTLSKIRACTVPQRAESKGQRRRATNATPNLSVRTGHTLPSMPVRDRQAAAASQILSSRHDAAPTVQQPARKHKPAADSSCSGPPAAPL
jgi:hypothetical protein